MAFFRRRDYMTSDLFLAEASSVASASSAFNGVLIAFPLAIGMFGANAAVLLVVFVVLVGFSITGTIGFLVHLVSERDRDASEPTPDDRQEPSLAEAV